MFPDQDSEAKSPLPCSHRHFSSRPRPPPDHFRVLGLTQIITSRLCRPGPRSSKCPSCSDSNTARISGCGQQPTVETCLRIGKGNHRPKPRRQHDTPMGLPSLPLAIPGPGHGGKRRLTYKGHPTTHVPGRCRPHNARRSWAGREVGRCQHEHLQQCPSDMLVIMPQQCIRHDTRRNFLSPSAKEHHSSVSAVRL
jgi:hypothetical protein